MNKTLTVLLILILSIGCKETKSNFSGSDNTYIKFQNLVETKQFGETEKLYISFYNRSDSFRKYIRKINDQSNMPTIEIFDRFYDGSMGVQNKGDYTIYFSKLRDEGKYNGTCAVFISNIKPYKIINIVDVDG